MIDGYFSDLELMAVSSTRRATVLACSVISPEPGRHKGVDFDVGLLHAGASATPVAACCRAPAAAGSIPDGASFPRRPGPSPMPERGLRREHRHPPHLQPDALAPQTNLPPGQPRLATGGVRRFGDQCAVDEEP